MGRCRRPRCWGSGDPGARLRGSRWARGYPDAGSRGPSAELCWFVVAWCGGAAHVRFYGPLGAAQAHGPLPGLTRGGFPAWPSRQRPGARKRVPSVCPLRVSGGRGEAYPALVWSVVSPQRRQASGRDPMAAPPVESPGQSPRVPSGSPAPARSTPAHPAATPGGPPTDPG